MNMPLKKILPVLVLLFLFQTLCQTQAYASPWAKKDGYFNKTGNKFTFALKHSLFSWMSLWTESREPGYKNQWEGFSAGFGKTVVYTAGGLVQLVTFPIPADFPDFGIGMHIPTKECPARHAKDYVPPVKNPLSKKAAEQQAAKSVAAKPALKPLTTPSTAPAEPPPAPAPVIMEVKTPEAAPVEKTVEEKTELEKAQEAELAAAAASTAVETPIAPAPKTDEVHESNENIVDANPQAPAEEKDKDDLWDEENFDDADQKSAFADDSEFEENDDAINPQTSAAKPAE